MSRPWTADELSRLIAMCNDGLTLPEISTSLSRAEQSLRKKCRDMSLFWGGYNEARAKGGHSTSAVEKYDTQDGGSYRPKDHRVSNIWHLIDLKRAGHSPTRTELRIESDGLAKVYHPDAVGSVSSPAYLCAEG